MTVRIKITADKIKEVATVDEFIGIFTGRILETISVMQKLVVNDEGDYVSPEEARRIVGGAPWGEYLKVAEQLREEIRNTLVNPTKGGG